jgi:hypothetical protein
MQVFVKMKKNVIRVTGVLTSLVFSLFCLHEADPKKPQTLDVINPPGNSSVPVDHGPHSLPPGITQTTESDGMFTTTSPFTKITKM